MWNGNASWPAGTGVCGEHCGAPHFGERIIPVTARREQVAEPLQHHECRVAFIQMPHRRRVTERPQREDAAKTQHNFLLQSGLAASAVQPRRQLAIPRCVLLEIRVEQHENDARLAVDRLSSLDRGRFPVDVFVVFLLPAFGRDPLAEIALRIHESDADDGNPQFTGFLAVIAGEHAEAA